VPAAHGELHAHLAAVLRWELVRAVVVQGGHVGLREGRHRA
jgi:hypothetical protein